MNNQYRNPVAALTNKKTEIYIAELPAIFGRNDNSVDIYYFHESISREHCMFECINRKVTVRDLGSTVGTAVNGVKLEPNIPYNIEDGAKITIGKVKFVFRVDYEELARRERERVNTYNNSANTFMRNDTSSYTKPGDPATGSPAAGSSGRTPKTVTVSARKLTEYEYGEEEVVYIECGLKPEKKPVSFTSEFRKKDIESVLLNKEAVNEKKNYSSSDYDEIKKTQYISREEIKEENTDNAALSQEDSDKTENDETRAGTKKEKNGKMLHLSWLDDETGQTKKLDIDQFPFSIGRKSDVNDYALRRKGISRKHIHFEETDSEYFVIDDNSTNGVKLNGVRIKAEERTKLKSGDKINIADVTVTVRLD